MDYLPTIPRQDQAVRSGATALAVLIILSIVCLLAHQTVRTIFLVRQGQDYSAKIAQAQEVLALGKALERRFRTDTSRLTAYPIVVQLGDEFARLEFVEDLPKPDNDQGRIATNNNPNEGKDDPTLDFMEASQPTAITRITAAWPVDSQGAELPNRVPIVASWELHPH